MNAPYQRYGAYVSDDAGIIGTPRCFVAHVNIPAPAAASTTGIHAAITDTGEEQEITTGITSPAVARNVTATAGGTAADIKAIQVVIVGKRAGKTVTITLPAFTENTAGTVQSDIALDEINSITIPAHDGTGATTAVGWGNKFGLPYKLNFSGQAIVKLFNKAADTGTVTADADELGKNVFAVNGTPDGAKDIDLFIVV